MIRVEKVSKYYGGKRALGPVSFTIEDGETVGFLGLNGAGKTTALRILACDLRPSGGTVVIDDVDALADPHAVRRRVGFLPENPPLYQDMTVEDYLYFAGQLHDMSKDEVKKRIARVCELTHLEETRNEIIGQLSHGYRQRVGVAQAIIHNPKLLILDEPTRGLDPVQIVEMRKMIQDLKESHTVLISSHILPEISQTCDRLMVLGKGEIVATGTESKLTEGAGKVTAVTAVIRIPTDSSDKHDAVTSCIKAVTGVDSVSSSALEGSTRTYRVACSTDVRAELSRAIVKAGYDLLEINQSANELERTFLKLVQGDRDASN